MNKRDFKAEHFKNMEELLNTIDTWLNNENLYGTLYDDFNRFFDTGAMEEMYYYIKQLQNNWNELKNYIEEWLIKNETWYSNSLSTHDKNYYREDYLLRKANLTEIKNKMQKLEQGKDENN